MISSTFLPSHDGVSITLYERLKKLSEEGHSVLCFVSSYAEVAHIYPDWPDYIGHIFPRVEVVALAASKEWMGIKEEVNPRRQSLSILNEALVDFKPEIIQVEEPERLWTTLFTLPGLSYAKEQKIPYIGCYRTNFIDYIQDYAPAWQTGIGKLAAKLLTKWVYNQFSITLVGSRFIEQKLISWGIRNVDYANVIGPLVVRHPEKLKNSGFFAEFFNLPEVDETVKVLFLGSLTPQKNWEFICKYLRDLEAKSITKKFTILVAGRGELEASIRSSDFAQILPTVMLGEVPHEQIPRLLSNVDLHVTSALKETFGRTVQESLHVGTPVLAPDCEWARNLVQSDYNGVLYKAGDGTDFIDKLAALIENSGDRQLLGQNALSGQYAKNDPTSNWLEYLQEKVDLSRARVF